MKKPILLNPGPVCTSERVRNALMKGDMCHRESEFSTILANTRKKILQAFAPKGNYTTAIINGSGTASLEAGICSSVSDGKKILIINNGIYGERISRISSAYIFTFLRHPVPCSQHLLSCNSHLFLPYSTYQ